MKRVLVSGAGGYVGLATMNGALIYNTTSNRLEVYIDDGTNSGWCGIHTVV